MSSDDYMLLGMLHRRAADHRADIRDFTAHIAQLKHENEWLRKSLVVEKSVVAGFRAQLKAYQAEHPTSKLLADSGKKYFDGEMKTVGRLIWEKAFDEMARSLGERKPTSIRVN